MKTKQIIATSLTFIVMLCCSLSCNDKEDMKPASTYSIKPVTDPKIKAEILSMVEGTEENSSGRSKACCSGVTLPSGYDYNNMQEVTIDGTNWVTYVAYSTSQNTSVHKDMVGIYYQNSTFKNWMYVKWKHRYDQYIYTYWTPPGYPTYYQEISLYYNEEGGEEVHGRRFRYPNECGDYVAGCIGQWYGGSGWVSVGLSFGTLFIPEIGVGVIDGCMLSCALGY